MMSWRKILCPVDFSDTSHAALLVAVDLAVKLGASIELLHVIGTPVLVEPPAPDLIGPIVAASRRSLDEWKREAEALGAPAVDAVQALGPTAETILARAHHECCDAIVMGTHGRGFIRRAILGSVAEQVFRRAPCPVVTVGPNV